MSARIGVITFPGSLDDSDTARAVGLIDAEAVGLWHGDADLRGVDAVILPGGFSYGDYLRAGAIARFAPVMGEVVAAARRGLPVLGICNGFQNTATAWTSRFGPGAEILVPIKHMEGCYVADKSTVDELDGEGRVVFRYLDNPNGSRADIAGITDPTGRVVGLMPHPEHATDALTGPSDDGLGMFLSVLDHLVAA